MLPAPLAASPVLRLGSLVRLRVPAAVGVVLRGGGGGVEEGRRGHARGDGRLQALQLLCVYIFV